MSKIDRVFKISDGLAHLAGKKITAAVTELKKEKIITAAESSQILSQLTQIKKNIYDSGTKEMKKLIKQTQEVITKRKTAWKKKR